MDLPGCPGWDHNSLTPHPDWSPSGVKEKTYLSYLFVLHNVTPNPLRPLPLVRRSGRNGDLSFPQEGLFLWSLGRQGRCKGINK